MGRPGSANHRLGTSCGVPVPSSDSLGIHTLRIADTESAGLHAPYLFGVFLRDLRVLRTPRPPPLQTLTRCLLFYAHVLHNLQVQHMRHLPPPCAMTMLPHQEEALLL